ncbi:FMN-binding negative transcriptional regulator [Sphingomonas montanisoli]|uniref:FMN-binding negative transcriptional regulator n=1 Tax=Sphingomonas montanisoli TaxID=2606412 RepID=A0A5D9C507_9SPHN|nr:FMN-binding negative transcriptional regulator [Sphingomonas montanisoli]TZG26317.1 FMN-binding negative transcriptional regulator [Sphingomonas montanisoli]
MHPAKSFAWDDVSAMAAFARDIAFAHLCVAGPDGPIVAHAPLLVAEDGSVLVHLSRGNRILRHLDGATIVASIAAHDFYVSPDWYEAKDSVPTWDYVAVEIEGTARLLDQAELVAQLDGLSAEHEARLAPKPAWTRDKMPEGRFDAMLSGISGFSIDAPTWRGTRKLSQNRAAADRAGVIAALETTRPDLAALVAQERG